MSENDYPKVGGRSAKIALVLLVIVYIFNFVDRQILSVLAEEIKADLNICLLYTSPSPRDATLSREAGWA